MGHGTHWECIYPDAEGFVKRLPDVIAHGTLISQVAWTDPACIPEGKSVDRLMVLAHPNGELRQFVVLMGRSQPKESFLFTAYPAALGGRPHEMTVAEVLLGTHGAEGQVTATTASGRTLTFFDPLFYLNKGRYALGRTYGFLLAALAYRVQPLDRTVMEIDDPAWRAAFDDGVGDPAAPVRIQLAGTSYMMPLQGWDVDDYAFQVQAGPSQPIVIADTTIDRTVMDIRLGGDAPIDITLYVAPHVRKGGFRPAIGEDMTGTFWLQGTLADTLERL